MPADLTPFAAIAGGVLVFLGIVLIARASRQPQRPPAMTPQQWDELTTGQRREVVKAALEETYK